MGAKIIKPKIIIICGPTALGKTAIAISLAETFNGEIVGADSMQVYKYMDIGTAKPTHDEQSRVTHHMIDIVVPDEHFDTKAYARLAREKVTKLNSRGITPFIVGGTGLYIKALLHGLFEAGESDPLIRSRLKEEVKIYGSAFLYKRLSRKDHDTAKKIHPNDAYRIIRALEVHESTGKTMAQLHREHSFKDNPFDFLKIGLHINRDILYDRINRRVDAMIDTGFVGEVTGLLEMGYASNLKSMQSIGYRHMVDFIQGRYEWNETVRTLKRDTRRYAKRQLTWFKADSDIIWTEPRQLSEIRSRIEKFLNAK